MTLNVPRRPSGITHILHEHYTCDGVLIALRPFTPFAGGGTTGQQGNLRPTAPSPRISGAMSAAAYSSPVDRMSGWLKELERILTEFDTLPSAAQDAVNSVVESLLCDPDTGDADLAQLNALLAARRPDYDRRSRRRTSLSQTRTRYAHRILLTISQSS
jgi:hypothetical protein